MEKKYREDKKIQNHLIYHVVFATRYKRKFFESDEIRERLKVIIEAACMNKEYLIIKLEVFPNYIHITIQAPPFESPSSIIHYIKSESSTILRKEFSIFKNSISLWTNNAIISIEELNKQDIQSFLSKQKTRG